MAAKTRWLGSGVFAMMMLLAPASRADVISPEESEQRATQEAAEKECRGKAAQTPCAIGKSKGTCIPATCGRSYSELRDGRAVRLVKSEACTTCNAVPEKPGEAKASRCSASPLARGQGAAGAGAAGGMMMGLACLLARRRRRGVT